MKTDALSGRRILITRAADDADGWAVRLRALGAHPVLLPCITRETIDDAATQTALRSALRDADWLVLASTSSAAAVAALAGVLPERVRVAAVGRATAQAATRALRAPSLTANPATSAELGRALVRALRAEASTRTPVVVIAGAAGGRTDVEEALAGVADVRRIDVYRTIAADPAAEKRDFGAEGLDIVLLASPSAVQGFVNRVALPVQARIVTIGPTTTQAARSAGLAVAAEAADQSLDGMLKAL